jgi:hypothetical protein
MIESESRMAYLLRKLRGGNSANSAPNPSGMQIYRAINSWKVKIGMAMYRSSKKDDDLS